MLLWPAAARYAFGGALRSFVALLRPVWPPAAFAAAFTLRYSYVWGFAPHKVASCPHARRGLARFAQPPYRLRVFTGFGVHALWA